MSRYTLADVRRSRSSWSRSRSVRSSRSTCWSTSSLKTPQIPAAIRSRLHGGPTLRNFAQAWHEAALGAALINSALVTVASVADRWSSSARSRPTPLARDRRRAGRRALFVLFMLGLLLPFQLALLPLYQTIRDLDLLGTLWATHPLLHRAPDAVHDLPLHRLPAGAAPRLRGGRADRRRSPLQAFRRVVFPLLRPITGTVVILNAIFIWNDFFTPLLYLSGSDRARRSRWRSSRSSASTSSNWPRLRRPGDRHHADPRRLLRDAAAHHQRLRRRAEGMMRDARRPSSLVVDSVDSNQPCKGEALRRKSIASPLAARRDCRGFRDERRVCTAPERRAV